jgi:hypothetical protein
MAVAVDEHGTRRAPLQLQRASPAVEPTKFDLLTPARLELTPIVVRFAPSQHP